MSTINKLVEDNLKLELLCVFAKAGRNQPFPLSEARTRKSLRDCLDAVTDAGIEYESFGGGLVLRKEVIAAELYLNLGYEG